MPKLPPARMHVVTLEGRGGVPSCVKCKQKEPDLQKPCPGKKVLTRKGS